MTRQYPHTQHGFVLVLTLIFMVVLTIMGLGLGIATTDEEKMARNFRDRDIAFAAAEAAMRDAEIRITGAYKSPYDLSAVSPLAYNDTCANAMCDAIDSSSAKAWQPVDSLDFYATAGTGSNSKPIGDITGSPTIKGLSSFFGDEQPRYMIERISTTLTSDAGVVYAYRVTIQARGRLPNTRVTLQEIFIPSASYEN